MNLSALSSFLRCKSQLRRSLAAVVLLAASALRGVEPAEYAWSHLAGAPEVAGYADGSGAEVRFGLPSGVAVDGSGNVYVADTANSVIRKITSAGVVTTLAGAAGQTGSANGTGAVARFNGPTGIAVDGSGNLYVADTSNETIRKITSAGVVTTLAGSAGQWGSTDGTGSAARFCTPVGIAVGSGGTIYVADSDNSTIRKITSAGVVTTLAGSAEQEGSADGTGAAARFSSPRGVAVDAGGNVYVADTGNDTIRKITSGGVVTTLAGDPGDFGSADGTGADALFNSPRGVAVDGGGNVYVADTGNQLVRKVTGSGVVTTVAGAAGLSGSVDGTGVVARFVVPCGIATTSTGTLFVADSMNCTIRKITTTGAVSTVAGPAGQSGSVDATGSAARFCLPGSIAVDGSGNTYVADTANSVIRKITSAGVVTTLAGAAGQPGSADGAGTVARFATPEGVAVDTSGNVYVADTGNETIRKITSAGVVTTLAGSAGESGSANGTGVAARFDSPSGIAVGSGGVVYVADAGNHTIRKITSAGVVTTLAGSAGLSGSVDGTGAAARFDWPCGVAVDGSGNVYVADLENETIRKITSTGVVTTLAGSAGEPGSADGTGAAARFGSPSGVAVDNSGNVFVADFDFCLIRTITSGGVVTTIGGSSAAAGSADGVGSVARFAGPSGIAIDSTGSLHVADRLNHSIRKGSLARLPEFAGQPQPCLGAIGEVAVFSVTASGSGPFSYGWQVSADVGVTWQPLSDGNGFSGTRTERVSVVAAPALSGAQFRCVVTNVVGSVTSTAATLTVDVTPVAPSFVAQPADQAVASGANPSFAVSAAGNPVPTYQWQVRASVALPWAALVDGDGASGSTTALLSLSAVPSSASGRQYRCVATNSLGSVASQPATLLVNGATPVAPRLSWNQHFFGSTAGTGSAADLADPDVDGWSNLLEYATGSSPVSSASGAVLDVGPSSDADGKRLEITFHRIADPALVYSVETSADLSTWQVIWSSTGAENVEGSVVVTDSETVENHPRRFLRLRVTN